MNLCLRCDTPAPYSWYCRRHYLEKEARYALYDIFHNPEYLKEHKDFTLNRLLAYASYLQSSGKN